MKPKTFTYNQIILFFQNIGLPLTKNQVAAITAKNREDIKRIEAYKKRKVEEKQKKSQPILK